jgi:hypothetical protein
VRSRKWSDQSRSFGSGRFGRTGFWNRALRDIQPSSSSSPSQSWLYPVEPLTCISMQWDVGFWVSALFEQSSNKANKFEQSSNKARTSSKKARTN